MFKDTIGEFDLFGQEVKLTYKGKESFSTLPGSIISILILITIVGFASYRMYVLVNRLNPAVSQQSFLKDLNLAEAFNPFTLRNEQQ
jgi:hypothetical protein